MTEETSINNDNKINALNLKKDNLNFNQENKVQNLFNTPKKIYSNNSYKDLNNTQSKGKIFATVRTKLTREKSDLSIDKHTHTEYNEPKKMDEKFEIQIKELENKLIEKDKEINECKKNITKINEENDRLKLLISKNEKQYNDLVKEYKIKDERASKNISWLKNQINEKNLLLLKKEKDILNFQESIKKRNYYKGKII